MFQFVDQQYLLNDQYKDASHLKQRLHIWQQLGLDPREWYRWIFDHIHLPPQSHVLELGCGSGDLWQENLERIPPDWQVTLSDLSPGMLQAAQHTLGESGQRFTYQVLDAQSIPYEPAHFDGVIANLMLYHVPDLSRALSEIRRVLKPGGMFYTTTTGATGVSEAGRKMMEASLASSSFSLENGEQQLSRCFSHVELYRLEQSLRIAEAEPLAELFCSLIAKSGEEEQTRQYVRSGVEQELRWHGALIQIEFGLFVAWSQKS